MRRVVTEMHTIQNDDDLLDVDCEACYDEEWAGNMWKVRIFLQKEELKIYGQSEPDYFFSSGEADPFEEVKKEDVPVDVFEALDGRIAAAMDEILDPELEKLKTIKGD